MKRVATYRKRQYCAIVELNTEFNDYCVTFFIHDQIQTHMTKDVEYLSVATGMAQEFINQP